MATLQETLDRINRFEESQKPISTKEGALRAGGQGLAFGFGDELEALYRSRKNNTEYQDELKKSRDKLEAFRKQNPVVAYGSEIAGSIPTSLGGAGILAKAGIKGVGKVGAIQGATYGAGVGETEQERINQAVAGGAFGGVINKVASKILPQTTELAKKFLKNDIRLTGGQMVKESNPMGDLISGIESSSTSIPGVGVAISNAKTRALSDFNKFAMLEAIDPILNSSSKKLLKKKLAKVDGTEAYKVVDDFIQKQYADVLEDITLGPDNIIALQDDIATVLANSNADTEGQKLIQRVLNQIFVNRLKTDKNGNKFLTGKDYKKLESELFRLQTNYFKKLDFDADNIAETFKTLRGVFKESTNLTAGGPRLQKVNMAFARLNPIAEAVSSANKTEGIFSASQLLTALKKTDLTKGKKVTKTGTDSMLPLAREGEKMFGRFVPDSGTASRLIAGEGAISPSNLLRYVAPSFLSKLVYNDVVPRVAFNAPNMAFQGLRPTTTGLLSGPLAEQGQGLLNRRNQ